MGLSGEAQLHLRLITRHVERKWGRLQDFLAITAALLGEEVHQGRVTHTEAHNALVQAIVNAHRNPTDVELACIDIGLRTGESYANRMHENVR